MTVLYIYNYGRMIRYDIIQPVVNRSSKQAGTGFLAGLRGVQQLLFLSLNVSLERNDTCVYVCVYVCVCMCVCAAYFRILNVSLSNENEQSKSRKYSSVNSRTCAFVSVLNTLYPKCYKKKEGQRERDRERE